MISSEFDTFYPKNREEWREWLAQNHLTEQSVWLVFYKKATKIPTISWSEAVDEALCFGWIDSVKKSVDKDSSIQYFSKRKAKSTWSKINKEKIEKLTEMGLMMPAGIKCVEIAKQNGSWTILDSAEALILPKDFEQKLNTVPEAKDYFFSLSKSMKKNILQWFALAKREETRQKRIDEVITLAAQKQSPKQF